MGNKQSQQPLQGTWKIAADTMIMTSKGPRHVESIKPHEIVEFFTDLGWVKAKRTPYVYDNLTTIEISDGTKITLSPGVLISDGGLNIGAIINSFDNCLEMSLTNVPTIYNGSESTGSQNNSPSGPQNNSPSSSQNNSPSSSPTPGKNTSVRDWYRSGYIAGTKSLKNSSYILAEYPDNEECAANFINGWTAAQSGFLTGTYNEIMALYFMLRLAKTTNIIVEKMFENRYKIIASNYKYAGDNVKWCVHLSRRSRHIINVFMAKKVKCCSFEFFDYDKKTSYVDIGPVVITTNADMFKAVNGFERGVSVTSTPVSSAETKSLNSVISSDSSSSANSVESSSSATLAASLSSAHGVEFVNYGYPQVIAV